MCVVAIAWDAHSEWLLLVAGNRDEYHARASAPLAHWNNRADIIAGRDLVSGGSWMGVSETGRFAVVTNIRDADGPDPAKASRGALVSDWLAEAMLPQSVEKFNPFNLIVAGPDSLRYLANRPEPVDLPLDAGIHGLSNAIADEHWPRKDRLNARLAQWMEGPAERPDELLDMLADQSLPDRDAHPIFILSPTYGTRCSTVIAVDRKGRGQIIERRFDADGMVSGEIDLRFTWHG